jgi:hypothetical protein
MDSINRTQFGAALFNMGVYPNFIYNTKCKAGLLMKIPPAPGGLRFSVSLILKFIIR